MQNIKIIHKLQSQHLEQLVVLYQNEFWCHGRKLSDVSNMLEHSDVVLGVVDEYENLVGFCRLLTDYTYKATLYDLIVHPDWRKQNLGRLFMDTAMNLPALRNIEHIDLNCLPEMIPFYKKWQFTDMVDKIIHMRRYLKQ